MNEGNQTETTKFKCEYCGEAEFDTAAQLRGHQMKCRPKSTDSDEEKKDEQQIEQMKKQEIQGDSRQERTKRVPFGVKEQRFIDVPNNDGYHYRVFNDNWRREPGRVQRALNAGYRTVEHPLSGSTVGTNEDGTEIKGVLMRIPEEMWEQDQVLKEGSRAVIEEQIYRGVHTARRGDGRYVPNEGIRMENKLTP